MKTKTPLQQLKLSVPAQEAPITDFLTASGTFHDGGLVLNLKGLRLISEENEGRPSDCKELDLEFSLEDLETIKVIGKGSGGVVQLVRHKWVGKLFALKVIQMNIQEDIRKQIVQELKINQASQCSHIVVCYRSFYHNGVFSLVLEYMDRGSLVDVIKQVKTLLEPYLAVVCKQVLQGLVYLHHERHVIHRDIKPSNLLVNHKGEVKITDFGVSAMLASSMGQRDTFVGTYNYMSPERISGSSYDYSSDIWSLGMVVLECAIGRFPYIQSEDQQAWPSFYELLDAIVRSPPPTAPSDQFSPEFCSFVSSCIQKNPKDRSSSLELLSHPFIKKFDGKDIDLETLMMIMSQGAKHMCFKEQPSWVIMERAGCDDGDHSVSSFSGSDESTSFDSSSSSSLDLMEDASSSATSSSNGPLYELSDLMSHLPIKRGLSNYYQGKSQSFTSLASVKSGEDLVKKENPCKRKSKSKSYGDMNKYSYSPKPTIAKKVPRGRSFLSSSSSVFCKKSTGFRPQIHVQKSF